jgi:diguanylate cyclase (GGDEF)-like protein/PAS domain S-box-containing protein
VGRPKRQPGLHLDKELLAPLFRHVSDAVIIFGSDMRILSMNSVAEKLSGYEEREVVNEMFCNEIFTCQDESGEMVCKDICPRVKESTGVHATTGLEVNFETKEGRSLILPGCCVRLTGKDGSPMGALLIRDAVSERALEEQGIENRRIDPLTGLFNRQYFEELYRKEIQRASRHGGRMAIVRLDVTGLKQINESHSARIGDEVLRAMGEMLKDSTRAVDIASRLGDDEFAVLLIEAGLESAKSLVGRLRNKMAEWNRIGRFPVPVDARMGAGAADRDFEVLMKQAKDALQ